ncbi:hypothetical protein BC828DRAFT_265280 [Blastocladiella britannica]|nr:hypothetical protein BC828DRAFT_265280 [Blastocladiella britannica]
MVEKYGLIEIDLLSLCWSDPLGESKFPCNARKALSKRATKENSTRQDRMLPTPLLISRPLPSRMSPLARLLLGALLLTSALVLLEHRRRALLLPTTLDHDDHDDKPGDPPRRMPLLVWSKWYDNTHFWEGRRIDYCGAGRPACIVTHDRM